MSEVESCSSGRTSTTFHHSRVCLLMQERLRCYPQFDRSTGSHMYSTTSLWRRKQTLTTHANFSSWKMTLRKGRSPSQGWWAPAKGYPVLTNLTLSEKNRGKTLTRCKRETGKNFVCYLLRGVFQSHRVPGSGTFRPKGAESKPCVAKQNSA